MQLAAVNWQRRVFNRCELPHLAKASATKIAPTCKWRLCMPWLGGAGREVNTSGDGFLAMFDGPQRAIRCAMAIRDAVQSLGIEVRAGLHTGECEVRGDGIGGIGVHIGARVSALAGPNDVLVSSTLRDLVIGSGLEFEERGAHELKGVPGEWRLFAVASS
jgi:class 3 adenylate cyclase